QQTAARVIVLRVGLEVLGQVDDALGEDRDLDFRAAGVAFGAGVVGNDRGLPLGGNSHLSSFDIRLKPRTTQTSWSLASTRATGVLPSIARLRPVGAAIPNRRRPSRSALA